MFSCNTWHLHVLSCYLHSTHVSIHLKTQPMPSVLVSWGCYNEIPQLVALNKQTMLSYNPEASRSRSRWQQGCACSETMGRTVSSLSSSWWGRWSLGFLGCGCVPAVSASMSHRHLTVSSSYKDATI